MPKKPLIETNPHLRDAQRRRKAIITNVSSNTSVETGRKPAVIARVLTRSGVVPLKTREGSGR